MYICVCTLYTQRTCYSNLWKCIKFIRQIPVFYGKHVISLGNQIVMGDKLLGHVLSLFCRIKHASFNEGSKSLDFFGGC